MTLESKVYDVPKKKFHRVTVAIICLTIIEAIALMKGVNGILLTLVIGAISGLGGYTIGEKQR